MLHRLCQHMACRMTVSRQTGRIMNCQNIQTAVTIHHGSQIHNPAVYFTCTGISRKAFADIRRNIIYGHRLIIFFY